MSDIARASTQSAERPVTALTGAAAAIYTELYGKDGTTASALALAAGVSPSAARKALATLEEQGLARRKPGGNDGTRRLADTWYTAPPVTDTAHTKPLAGPASGEAASSGPGEAAPTAENASEAGVPSAEGEAAAPDGRPQTDESSAGAGDSIESQRGVDAVPGKPEPAGAANAAVQPADRPESAPPTVCPTCGHRRRAAAPRTAGSGTRLGSGQLHQLVLGHLREHPGEDWTATGIANAVGRSAGAIANALATMVNRGEAEQACDKPRRYRATALVDAD